MNLINLANAVWQKRTTVKVDPTQDWEEDFFRKNWFYDKEHSNKYVTQSPGWYWIGRDMDYDELRKQELPMAEEFPKSACHIPSLSEENFSTFGCNSLCKKDDYGSLIIYNGHQINVLQRIRQHFMLNNHKTGAIGLRFYPLSNRTWTISYFTVQNINQLEPDLQKQVEKLILKKSGRVAIENAWRAQFGWPVLCKA